MLNFSTARRKAKQAALTSLNDKIDRFASDFNDQLRVLQSESDILRDRVRFPESNNSEAMSDRCLQLF